MFFFCLLRIASFLFLVVSCLCKCILSQIRSYTLTNALPFFFVDLTGISHRSFSSEASVLDEPREAMEYDVVIVGAGPAGNVM
jgi:hypothetical protein